MIDQIELHAAGSQSLQQLRFSYHGEVLDVQVLRERYPITLPSFQSELTQFLNLTWEVLLEP